MKRSAALAAAGLTAILLGPGLGAGQPAPPAATPPAAAPAAPIPLVNQPDAPHWLYPLVERHDAIGETPHGVPGSTVTYTEKQLRDMSTTLDWRPEEHPPMPTVVATGRKGGVLACGFCHLATGQGRVESAPVAGLPAPYFIGQVRAFASHLRHSSNSGGAARPDGTTSNGRWTMAGIAEHMTDDDIKAAADYYAGLKYKPWITVKESDSAPPLIYDTGYPVAQLDKPSEPIAGRIVEYGADQDRAFIRDPDVGFIALVPKGSLARGAALVASGTGTAKAPCAKCHGDGLKGGDKAIGPPIAGRSPTYIARAMYDFGHGSRDDPAARPMKGSAAGVPIDDIVAIAAYVASLQP